MYAGLHNHPLCFNALKVQPQVSIAEELSDNHYLRGQYVRYCIVPLKESMGTGD